MRVDLTYVSYEQRVLCAIVDSTIGTAHRLGMMRDDNKRALAEALRAASGNDDRPNEESRFLRAVAAAVDAMIPASCVAELPR